MSISLHEIHLILEINKMCCKETYCREPVLFHYVNIIKHLDKFIESMRQLLTIGSDEILHNKNSTMTL